jgi:membrane fusion protein (multidrug efflux system)
MTLMSLHLPKVSRSRAVATAAMLLLLSGAGTALAQPPGGMPPPQVTFVTVEPRDLFVAARHLGVAEASRVVEVRSRVRGFLASRGFEEGSTVRQGDLLYEIERDSFSADVAIAEASLASAQARLRLAEKEYERRLGLFQKEAISESEVDAAKADVDVRRAEIALSEAELAKAKLQLSYTRVIAPLTGVIGRTEREIGSLVDDGSNSLMTRIYSTDPIYVAFGVSEREWLRLRSDSPVAEADGRTVTALAFEGELANGMVVPGGTLNFEDPTFDPSTGTTRIRVSFPNPKGDIKPGQMVHVRPVGLKREGVILVPKRAVIMTPQTALAFVIDETDTIQARPVEVGDWSQEDWVIRSGLQKGDRVMVDGLMKGASPGTKVTPVPASGSAPGTQAVVR